MEKKKIFSNELENILAESESKDPYAGSLLISELVNSLFIQYLYNIDDYPLDEIEKIVKDHIMNNILQVNSCL